MNQNLEVSEKFNSTRLMHQQNNLQINSRSKQSNQPATRYMYEQIQALAEPYQSYPQSTSNYHMQSQTTGLVTINDIHKYQGQTNQVKHTRQKNLSPQNTKHYHGKSAQHEQIFQNYTQKDLNSPNGARSDQSSKGSQNNYGLVTEDPNKVQSNSQDSSKNQNSTSHSD